MLIKIEIDVRPDELRRFLGLPDVAGLQDDVIEFLRDKIQVTSEFDAGNFVRNNIETLRGNAAWKKLVERVGIAGTVDEIAAAALQGMAKPAAPRTKKSTTAGKPTRRRTRKSS